jgi:hypothetical protein
MNKTRANLAGNPSYWVMDAAYDSLNIYETVMNDFHAQAIIALNHRGAKQPKAGYDFDGTPVCSAGFKMTYWGHHHGINKFRCPHVLGKVDCPFGSAWCSSSNYGLVVKTKAKDDPRMFNTPHRGSSNWKQLYNQRTASERCFGRQKEHLGLDEIRHRGVEKVETHAYLCNIALLATVIAINTPEKANVAELQSICFNFWSYARFSIVSYVVIPSVWRKILLHQVIWNPLHGLIAVDACPRLIQNHLIQVGRQNAGGLTREIFNREYGSSPHSKFLRRIFP